MNISDWVAAKAELVRSQLEQAAINDAILKPGQKLEFHLKVIDEPVVVAHTSTPESRVNGTFYRGRATYFRKALADNDLAIIRGLNWTGWKKRVTELFLGNSNRPAMAQAIKPLIANSAYDGVHQMVLNSLNTVFGKAKANYRLTFSEDGSPTEGPFRFYALKPRVKSQKKK